MEGASTENTAIEAIIVRKLSLSIELENLQILKGETVKVGKVSVKTNAEVPQELAEAITGILQKTLGK